MPDKAGSSVPDVFDPQSIVARFVVSMSMAKNDIESALRDAVRANKSGEPDFRYRVRAMTGHLIEALDALDAYQQDPAVRALIAKVRQDAQTELTKTKRLRQQIGKAALKSVRDNTFHYPSPKPNYSPTSDEQLAQVLAGMTDVEVQLHLDRDTDEIRMLYADEVALALAIGMHHPDPKEQLENTRDAAIAFVNWVIALTRAYFDDTRMELAEPCEIPKPTS